MADTVDIKELKELTNPEAPVSERVFQTFYPLTHEKAVRDSQGNSLDSKLAAINEGVQETIDEAMQELSGLASSLVEDYKPIVIEGDVTNAPDEEDLTSYNNGSQDVIRLKDKDYNSLIYSGLGRVYLRKNMDWLGYHFAEIIQSAASVSPTVLTTKPDSIVFETANHRFLAKKNTTFHSQWTYGNAAVYLIPEDDNVYVCEAAPANQQCFVWDDSTTDKLVSTTGDKGNILTQSMMNKANTIYVIQYDYDLNGESITVPEGCVLEFDGGSLKNGELVGQNTAIEAGLVKIFDIDMLFSGDWCFAEVYPEWFGAKGDGVADDTAAIQKAVKVGSLDGIRLKSVVFSRRLYLISDTITVPRFSTLIGVNPAERFNTDYNKPQIFINANNRPIIRIATLTSDTNISRVSINNLMIGRGGYYTEKGIDLSHSNILGLTIKDVHFVNVKFGIYSNTNLVISKTFLNNISVEPNHSVGFAIFLKTTSWMSQIVIKDCFITNTYIGGVRLECDTINTPIIFESCAFDKCGTQYNLDDYLEYGTSSVFISCAERGNVCFNGCYFETAFPFRDYGDGTYNSEYEVANSELGQIYILGDKIDKKNTAEIVLHGNPSTTPTETTILNIQNCEFQVNYQSVSVVRSGRINVSNTLFLRPGISGGVPVYAFYDMQQPSIVRLIETIGENTHVFINNIANRVSSVIIKAIEIVSDVSGAYIPDIEFDVNIDTPVFTTRYKYFGEGDSEEIYYDRLGSNNFNLGTPENPYTTISQIIRHSSLLRSKKGRKALTVICVNGIVFDGQSYFPEGIDYNFIIKDGIFDLNKQLTFKDSNIEIVGDIKKTSSIGYLLFYNGSFTLNNSEIGFTTVNNIPIFTGVNSKLTFKDVSIASVEDLPEDYSNQSIVADGGVGSLTTEYANFTNAANLYCYDSATSHIGDESNRPNVASTSIIASSKHGGVMYFNTTFGKPTFYNGVNWRFADGVMTTVKYSGTLADRPTDASRIYEGFRFLVNDGLNIYPIYAHISGNPATITWVDADGNPADAAKSGTTLPSTTGLQVGFQFAHTTYGLLVWDGSNWIANDGYPLYLGNRIIDRKGDNQVWDDVDFNLDVQTAMNWRFFPFKNTEELMIYYFTGQPYKWFDGVGNLIDRTPETT